MKEMLYKILFFPFQRKKEKKIPKLPKKILVVRQDNRIGNIILATPLFELIKKKWPNSELDVICGRIFYKILYCNPFIDKIIVYDQLAFIRIPLKFIKFFAAIRRNRYDIAFDLKTSFSFNNMMVTNLCGAECIVGFKNSLSNNFFDIEIDHPSPNEYEAQYISRLLTPFMTHIEAPPVKYVPEEKYLTKAKIFLEKKIDLKRKIIGIHIGGRGLKKFPIEQFIEIGNMISKIEIPVLFFTGPDEENDTKSITDNNFYCITKKDINEFGGFLPLLELFISCDTGPMHMAVGSGIKTFSLFITTSLDRYGSKSDNNVCININSIKINEIFDRVVALYEK